MSLDVQETDKPLQREAKLTKMYTRPRPEPFSQTGTKRQSEGGYTAHATILGQPTLGSWPVYIFGPKMRSRNDEVHGPGAVFGETAGSP